MRSLQVLLILALVSSAAGCVNTDSQSNAICDGTSQARADHAAALAVTTDENALRTGAVLISKIDAGCANGL